MKTTQTLTHYARNLRKQSTDAEQKLWYFLRNRHLMGYKFRRQHPIPPYIVDFICLDCHLIIELDGGHHADQAEADRQRSQFLAATGLQMLRFWNHEALHQTDSVLQEIFRYLPARSVS